MYDEWWQDSRIIVYNTAFNLVESRFTIVFFNLTKIGIQQAFWSLGSVIAESGTRRQGDLRYFEELLNCSMSFILTFDFTILERLGVICLPRCPWGINGIRHMQRHSGRYLLYKISIILIKKEERVADWRRKRLRVVTSKGLLECIILVVVWSLELPNYESPATSWLDFWCDPEMRRLMVFPIRALRLLYSDERIWLRSELPAKYPLSTSSPLWSFSNYRIKPCSPTY